MGAGGPPNLFHPKSYFFCEYETPSGRKVTQAEEERERERNLVINRIWNRNTCRKTIVCNFVFGFCSWMIQISTKIFACRIIRIIRLQKYNDEFPLATRLCCRNLEFNEINIKVVLRGVQYWKSIVCRIVCMFMLTKDHLNFERCQSLQKHDYAAET